MSRKTLKDSAGDTYQRGARFDSAGDRISGNRDSRGDTLSATKGMAKALASQRKRKKPPLHRSSRKSAKKPAQKNPPVKQSQNQGSYPYNDQQSKGNFIQGAIKKPGALHAQLGVPQGQKIPPSKMNAAAQRGGKLGQRARFAQTLKGLR